MDESVGRCWEFSRTNVLDVLRDTGFSAAHWWELGERLVPNLDVDTIEAQFNIIERRLEEAIRRWMNNGDKPSWETLASAVSQCTVGGGRNVSSKIRKKVGIDDGQRQSSNLKPLTPNDATGIEEKQDISPVSQLNSPSQMLNSVPSEEDYRRFNEMAYDTLEVLQKEEIEPRKVLFLWTMTDTDNKARAEHMKYLKELNEDLSRFETVYAIIQRVQMDNQWGPFNYYLLKKLIFSPLIERMEPSTCKNLTGRMRDYIKDVESKRQSQ